MTWARAAMGATAMCASILTRWSCWTKSRCRSRWRWRGPYRSADSRPMQNWPTSTVWCAPRRDWTSCNWSATRSVPRSICGPCSATSLRPMCLRPSPWPGSDVLAVRFRRSSRPLIRSWQRPCAKVVSSARPTSSRHRQRRLAVPPPAPAKPKTPKVHHSMNPWAHRCPQHASASANRWFISVNPRTPCRISWSPAAPD